MLDHERHHGPCGIHRFVHPEPGVKRRGKCTCGLAALVKAEQEVIEAARHYVDCDGMYGWKKLRVALNTLDAAQREYRP